MKKIITLLFTIILIGTASAANIFEENFDSGTKGNFTYCSDGITFPLTDKGNSLWWNTYPISWCNKGGITSFENYIAEGEFNLTASGGLIDTAFYVYPSILDNTIGIYFDNTGTFANGIYFEYNDIWGDKYTIIHNGILTVPSSGWYKVGIKRINLTISVLENDIVIDTFNMTSTHPDLSNLVQFYVEGRRPTADIYADNYLLTDGVIVTPTPTPTPTLSHERRHGSGGDSDGDIQSLIVEPPVQPPIILSPIIIPSILDDILEPIVEPIEDLLQPEQKILKKQLPSGTVAHRTNLNLILKLIIIGLIIWFVFLLIFINNEDKKKNKRIQRK